MPFLDDGVKAEQPHEAEEQRHEDEHADEGDDGRDEEMRDGRGEEINIIHGWPPDCSAGVPPAGWPSVSPGVGICGEMPLAPAAEDGRATICLQMS